MILGQTRTSGFVPPVPPHAKIPHTGFYSGNVWPFSQVMRRMSAFPSYRPPINTNAGPQMLPAPPPPPPPLPPAAPGSPAAVQVPSSAPPVPAATHGFGNSGFGSTGGVKAHGQHFHVDPYMVMRSGWIPGVHPSGSNIRAQVKGAGARIQRSMPFQTAPLPPPPPPPPPPIVMAPPPGAPMPTATHGFGHPPRRRHWLSRMVSPETVAEVDQRAGAGGCETYPPRADGIKVTVCNGRVVKYEDAQGNVNDVPDPNAMAGFGWPNWGNRGGGYHSRQYQQPYQPAYQPAAYTPTPYAPPVPGQYPHHHHHRHHPWQPDAVAPVLPPTGAPVPAFGRYW